MEVWRTTRNEPTTHALVVGIGDFPYCGTNPVVPGTSKIKNLSSPAYTAYSIANYFIANAERFHAKLGSVTLLTENLGQNSWAPTLPTFENLRSAFRTWQDKAGREDCLIMYWCGHGFQYENHQLLVCRDAGEDGNFWDKVYDVSNDFIKAYGSKPKTQLWCIDACRDAAEELKLLSPRGRGFLPDITQSAISHAAGKDLAFLNATGPFAKANGLVNQPSYFCKAFTFALDWAAWRDFGQQWQVLTTSFVSPMNNWFKEQEIETQCRSDEATGQHPIFSTAEGPLIPSSFRCEPANLQTQTTLSLLSNDREEMYAQDAPSDGAWQEKVNGGFYYLKGEKDNDNHTKESIIWIRPAVREGVLKWPT